MTHASVLIVGGAIALRDDGEIVIVHSLMPTHKLWDVYIKTPGSKGEYNEVVSVVGRRLEEAGRVAAAYLMHSLPPGSRIMKIRTRLR